MKFEEEITKKIIGESSEEQYENSKKDLSVDYIISKLSQEYKKGNERDISSVDSLISRNEKMRDRAMQVFAKHFSESHQEIERHLGLKEYKKSNEQTSIIEFVNDEANKLMEKYGIDQFDIPPDNVHLYSREDFNKSFQGKENLAAFYSPLSRAVIINQSEGGFNKAAFAHGMFHEFMHFHQYLEILVKDDCNLETDISDDQIQSKCRIIKNGFKIIIYKIKEKQDANEQGEKKEVEMYEMHLDKLQEALVEELSIRFHKDVLSNHPEFKKDKELFDEYLKQEQQKGNITSEINEGEVFWFRKKVTFSSDNRKEYIRIEAVEPPYKEERKILHELIEKIFENNPDRFRDREEVFDLFAKSLFTGNIVGRDSWGRLLDETFGKGTLKGLMEADSSLKNLKDLKEFVDNLPDKKDES